MATIELDVRGLQAPEPLGRVLANLDRVDALLEISIRKGTPPAAA